MCQTLLLTLTIFLFNNGVIMDMADYGLLFVGTKYNWGGNSPEQGYDCSGFVIELMASAGKKPPSRLTSQGIYMYGLQIGVGSGLKRNSLLFFGKSPSLITHVALAINGHQMVEAAGEGREPSDIGMVRVRPISSRSDLVGALCF